MRFGSMMLSSYRENTSNNVTSFHKRVGTKTNAIVMQRVPSPLQNNQVGINISKTAILRVVFVRWEAMIFITFVLFVHNLYNFSLPA